MYCSQCGKKIADDSRYCSRCGYPTFEEESCKTSEQHEPIYDAVKDIQYQLDMIDKREKPLRPRKANRSLLEIMKDTMFEEEQEEKHNNKFKEKKQADKQKLIQNYPFPSTPEEHLNFVMYIDSIITSTKKNKDPLNEAWKEKLKQAYLFAKKEFSTSAEFVAIQNIYKKYRREGRRNTFGSFFFFLFYLAAVGVGTSLLYKNPLLFFASVLGLLWTLCLMLYIYDLLNKMIVSIKVHAKKKKGSPKLLRIIAWFLLMPALAALITSIVYFSKGIIVLCAVIFAVDMLFILLSLCYLYDW